MLWLALHFPNLGLDVFSRQTFSQKNLAPKNLAQKPNNNNLSNRVDSAANLKTAVKQSALNRNALNRNNISPNSAKTTATTTASGTAKKNAADLPAGRILLEDGRISLMDRAAADLGIVLGSTLATAFSIAADIEYHHRRTDLEATALQRLAEYLYQFSSLVSIQAPDCLLLEIAGSERLFGQQSLIEAAVDLCQTLGFDCTARWASAPKAAIILARSRGEDLNQVMLYQAGLEHFSVADKDIERLSNMGVHSLGALLQLPRSALGQRFGQHLITLLDQLTGARSDPQKTIQPKPYFREALHLLQPITNKTTLLEGPMQRLTEQLQHWLVGQQLGCEKLQWQFTSQGETPCTVEVKFARGHQQQADFIAVSSLRLDHLDLPREILSITLQTMRLRPWQGKAHDLFRGNSQHTAQSESDDSIEDLIDQLSARYGSDICQGIRTHEQHRPEQAGQILAISQALNLRRRNRTHKTSTASVHGTLLMPDSTLEAGPEKPRPLWLFTQPQPIPAHRLEIISGPERIETDWWQASIQRDYYIARHASGALCWVFTEATAISTQALKNAVEPNPAPSLPADPTERMARKTQEKTERKTPQELNFSETTCPQTAIRPGAAKTKQTATQSPACASWYLHGYFA